MAMFPLFRAATGLKNTVEPHRLAYLKDGSCPLSEAVNVIIDDSGSVKRRYGIIEKFTGPVHSLWSWGEYCFFVSAGKLYRYYSSGTTLLISSSCGDAQMYFCEFGGKIFLSNGTFRAVISGLTISSWGAVIPELSKSDTRVLGLPSGFTKPFRHNGRLYLIKESVLWESLPFNPFCFDLGFGFIDLGLSILDAIPIQGGIYISTTAETFFLSGNSKDDFTLQKAYQFPMVPGTATEVSLNDLSGLPIFLKGIGAIWVSADGVCVGDDSGKVFNVSKEFLSIPRPGSEMGAGTVIPGFYFFSLED